MTVNASRLGAAFFVSVAIILALAATVLWFAMPVKVQAQSDLCVPAEQFMATLAVQPTVEFIELLGETRTVQYLEAATGQPMPSDANAILFIETDGSAWIVPIVRGIACMSYGVIEIPAPAHDRGMSAVYGEAI